MNKDISINIRIDEGDQAMLDELCQESVRTKSDMVRFLIRQERNRRQATDKLIVEFEEWEQRQTTDKPEREYAAE